MSLSRDIFNAIALKPIHKVFFLVLLLSAFPSMNAQNGYGFEDPYNVNGYGITGYGRRGNLPLEDISKLSKEAQEKIREETLKKTIAKLKTDLQLDELQLIVITKTITQCLSKQNAILAIDSSQDRKILETETLITNTEREILSFLNPNQKENFKLLVAEREKKFEKLKT